MENADKILVLPCTDGGFYRMWLRFLAPLHGMTDRVSGIAAELLRHRDMCRDVIRDERVLLGVICTGEHRAAIMRDCGLSLAGFRMALCKMRSAGFIVDGEINRRLIPDVRAGGRYGLMLVFKIREDDSGEAVARSEEGGGGAGD